PSKATGTSTQAALAKRSTGAKRGHCHATHHEVKNVGGGWDSIVTKLTDDLSAARRLHKRSLSAKSTFASIVTEALLCRELLRVSMLPRNVPNPMSCPPCCTSAFREITRP
ncbi:hypothetical protein DQ04_27531000, partial [Trypanosoma grayi]|uniref:hypothetical protein n=1 Tax=Trypanosoma grayi TaxID=71804 RepID=UPI0004F476A3